MPIARSWSASVRGGGDAEGRDAAGLGEANGRDTGGRAGGDDLGGRFVAQAVVGDQPDPERPTAQELGVAAEAVAQGR